MRITQGSPFRAHNTNRVLSKLHGRSRNDARNRGGPRLAVQIASVRCLLGNDDGSDIMRLRLERLPSTSARASTGLRLQALGDAREQSSRSLFIGSLAMGCFNPHASDIDVLVITQRRVGKQKLRLASLALATSLKPRPIEVTTFSKRDLNPWRYPTPFDFHFSEDWRGPRCTSRGKRARGVVLLGPPIETKRAIYAREQPIYARFSLSRIEPVPLRALRLGRPRQVISLAHRYAGTVASRAPCNRSISAANRAAIR